jgi:hypothetical protein
MTRCRHTPPHSVRCCGRGSTEDNGWLAGFACRIVVRVPATERSVMLPPALTMSVFQADCLLLEEMIAEADRLGWARASLSSIRDLETLDLLLAGVGRAQAPSTHHDMRRTLYPRREDATQHPSLSARFGTAAFPAHTDGAHERLPPRFVLLHCIADQQRRPTHLFRWRDIRNRLSNHSLLTREVFWFRTGRNSFADTIVGTARPFVRFDRGCMAPATRHAERLLADVDRAVESLEPYSVEWEPGTTVVIANWAALHGRGVALASGSRILLRAHFS